MFVSSAQRKDSLQLTIGYHQLEGQLVNLKKPLAILEKESKDNNAVGEAPVSSYKVAVSALSMFSNASE